MSGSIPERNELDDVCQQNTGRTGMIKTELIMVDERQLRRTWSDAGYMIERDGVVYSEAADPAEFDRAYTETEIPVELESTEEIISVGGGTVTE